MWWKGKELKIRLNDSMYIKSTERQNEFMATEMRKWPVGVHGCVEVVGAKLNDWKGASGQFVEGWKCSVSYLILSDGYMVNLVVKTH